MEKLDSIIEELKKLSPDFFGQAVIKIKNGVAVHMDLTRSIRLDDQHNDSKQTSH